MTKFKSFREFYPFYLSQHQNPTCIYLHTLGSWVSIWLVVFGVLTGRPWMFGAAIVSGYAFAWVGHFFFEKNRPATFTHPVYSFMGDWRMFWERLLANF